MNSFVVGWAQLCAAACGAIPVIGIAGVALIATQMAPLPPSSLQVMIIGVLIPTVVAVKGAADCAEAARDRTRPAESRVFWCGLTVVVCWGMFLVLGVGGVLASGAVNMSGK